MSDLSLEQLKAVMRGAGVSQLYVKRLAENDNSKNQIYFGPDFSALNIFPVADFISNPEKPNLLKAALRFRWIDSDGRLFPAPGAQLILYPQYPEVRFSGFLQGCTNAPSDLMTVRQSGRLLFLGITSEGLVIGYVVAHTSPLAQELTDLPLTDGVFTKLAVAEREDDRFLLLSELTRIAHAGWIDSKRLTRDGAIVRCDAPNCGGYTLEAELGIRPNGISDPDFHGWEVKQHAVTNLNRPASGGPITLMTPEPTGGYYVSDGVSNFLRRFGYADKKIADRLNFGGIHNATGVCVGTKLRLCLGGYDSAKRVITDLSSGILLLNEADEPAAIWHYAGLLSHWNRKHAKAVYVPSINKKTPDRQYQYGSIVRLGIGTDFLLFVRAVEAGLVYYDPGIKMEAVSSANPQIKRRSQFRIKSANIPTLYSSVEEVDLNSFA